MTSPSRFAAVLAALALTGCMGNIRGTLTARTSTEMLLVSGAAESAIVRWDASPLKGRRVFLDTQFLESYDEPYVTSALRAHVARAGAILVDREQAEWVMEVRCASLGTWEGDWLLGLPPLPLSFGGPAILTPSITIGHSSRQGWAKLEWFVYDAATLAVLGSSGTRWGMAREDLFGSVYPSIIDTARETVDGKPDVDAAHSTAEFNPPRD